MSNFDDQLENLSANVRSDYAVIMKAFESKANICLLLECMQRRDLSPFELVVETERARTLHLKINCTNFSICAILHFHF